MKVRVIKSFELDGNSMPIRAGEEYEVREYRPPLSLNPIFQIISGPRSGEKIPWDCCMELPKERTYTEAEYNAIRGQLDQASEHKRFAESVANQKINECNKLRRQHDKAIDDLARHAKELAGLRQERQMLLETIEKAAGEQPLMELPRDVVDALQSFFDDGYDVDHIVKCLLRISSGHSFPRLESIREYAAAHGYEFICALANGYTAEKTPEERLRAKVEELLYKWLDSPVDDAGAEEISQLAGQIVEHAKEITT